MAGQGIVGHDNELAAVSDRVTALLGGVSSRLVVEGEAGIGKTTVIDELVDEARRRGVGIRRGQAHPFERTRPFGAIADALGITGRSDDPRLAAVGRLIAGRSSASVDGDPPSTDVRHLVAEGIMDILETLCGSSPVVVALEHVHWADASTLMAVSSIAHRLRHVPLLVVVTWRPAPRFAQLDQLLELFLPPVVVAGPARRSR